MSAGIRLEPAARVSFNLTRSLPARSIPNKTLLTTTIYDVVQDGVSCVSRETCTQGVFVTDSVPHAAACVLQQKWGSG